MSLFFCHLHYLINFTWKLYMYVLKDDHVERTSSYQLILFLKHHTQHCIYFNHNHSIYFLHVEPTLVRHRSKHRSFLFHIHADVVLIRKHKHGENSKSRVAYFFQFHNMSFLRKKTFKFNGSYFPCTKYLKWITPQPIKANRPHQCDFWEAH